MLKSLTLEQLQGMSSACPELSQMAERLLVSNYDDFVRVLYADIDKCIVEIERNRELRQDSSEDLLSVSILSMLKMVGYSTQHEQKTGGHVDLTVSHRLGFEWLGEAKIHRSYDYLYQGFQQLCTRYSTGGPESSNGGVLVYIYNSDVASVMKKWKNHLKEVGLPDYKEINCDKRPDLSFYSKHKHAVSGLTYTVRHMAVMLHHKPQDHPKTKKNK